MGFGKSRQGRPVRSLPNPAGTAAGLTQRVVAASSNSRFLRPRQAGFGEVAEPYASFSTLRAKSRGVGNEPLDRTEQNVHVENGFRHVVVEADREIFFSIADHGGSR